MRKSVYQKTIMTRVVTVEIVAVTGFGPIHKYGESVSEGKRASKGGESVRDSLFMSSSSRGSDVHHSSSSRTTTKNHRSSSHRLSLQRPHDVEADGFSSTSDSSMTLSTTSTTTTARVTNSQKDGCDNTEDSDDRVVRYVLSVHDNYSNDVWTVSHRFSDFVRLRRALGKQGFYSIPPITSKSSFFHRRVTVINDRVVVLQRFINDCLHIVGLGNPILNVFLGLIASRREVEQSSKQIHESIDPNGSNGNNALPHNSSTSAAVPSPPSRRLFPFVSSTTTSFGKESATAKQTSNGGDDTYQNPFEKPRKGDNILQQHPLSPSVSMNAIVNHAFARKLTRNEHIVRHANYVIDEFVSLKQQLTSLQELVHQERHQSMWSYVIARWLGIHSSGQRNVLFLFERLMLHVFLFLLCLELVFLYDSVPITDSTTAAATIATVTGAADNGKASNESESSPFSILFHMLSLIVHSALASQLMHVLVKSTAVYCFMFNRYTRLLCWQYLWFLLTMRSLYLLHTQRLELWFDICQQSLSSFLFSTPTQGISILSESRLSSEIHTVAHWALSAVMTRLFHPWKLVSVVTVTLWHDCQVILSHYLQTLLHMSDDVLYLFTHAADLVRHAHVLTLICTIVLLIVFVTLMRGDHHHYRYLHLGSLSVAVFVLYSSALLLSFCLTLSIESSQRMFSYLDSIVAPYAVEQMKAYKSIFIKFGQYLSASHDQVPISLVWRQHLKELQDYCESSEFDFVRHQLERELNVLFEKREEVLSSGNENDDIHSVYNNLQSVGATTIKQSPLSAAKSFRSISLRLEDVFETIDPRPVASTSIAQVHLATINVSKLDKIYFKKPWTLNEDMSGARKETSSKNVEDSSEYLSSSPLTMTDVPNREGCESLGVLLSSKHRSLLEQQHSTAPWFSMYAHSNARSTPPDANTCSSSSTSQSFRYDWKPHNPLPVGILSVAVKVQHEHIREIMMRDMKIVEWFITLARFLDSRWKPLFDLLETWRENLENELDFSHEASNLEAVNKAMRLSRLDVHIPMPIPGFLSKSILVMTCLHGYKATDELALTLYEIDREALVRRLAHAIAYQWLVVGLYNADCNTGNLFICMAKPSARIVTSAASREEDSKSRKSREFSVDVSRYVGDDMVIQPAMLDFGLAMRLSDQRRQLYCRLILALFEDDYITAAHTLRSLGYDVAHTHRVDERDVDRFLQLFRDGFPTAHLHAETLEDNEDLFLEKKSDSLMPADFLPILRVMNMLRGLCRQLHCYCPVLHILALHAAAGLRIDSSSDLSRKLRSVQ